MKKKTLKVHIYAYFDIYFNFTVTNMHSLIAHNSWRRGCFIMLTQLCFRRWRNRVFLRKRLKWMIFCIPSARPWRDSSWRAFMSLWKHITDENREREREGKGSVKAVSKGASWGLRLCQQHVNIILSMFIHESWFCRWRKCSILKTPLSKCQAFSDEVEHQCQDDLTPTVITPVTLTFTPTQQAVWCWTGLCNAAQYQCWTIWNILW